LYRSEKLTARLETPRETQRSNEDIVAPGTHGRGGFISQREGLGADGKGWGRISASRYPEPAGNTLHVNPLPGRICSVFWPLSQMECDVKFNRANVCTTQARRSAPLSVCPTAKSKSTWTDIGIGSLGCHHGAAAKAQSTRARIMADILG
jgi:hypothetical protein